jgi:hypothetical protein
VTIPLPTVGLDSVDSDGLDGPHLRQARRLQWERCAVRAWIVAASALISDGMVAVS